MTPKEFLSLEDEDGICDDYADHDDVQCVEEGEWCSEGKYELRTDVFKWKPTGQFFAVHSDRSGSYHSDYYYGEPSCNEVFPHSVTQTVYLAKK